jgi:hypothetical protein
MGYHRPHCANCWGRGRIWSNATECSNDGAVEPEFADCEYCEKMGRDQIPWAELFTLGRGLGE